MSHIEKPNYTQIPNIVLDHWMNHLSHAEFKILLYICRKTFGWHKEGDTISYRQLCDGTGVSRSHAIKAIQKLIELNLIEKKETQTQYGDQGPCHFEIKIEMTGSHEKTGGWSYDRTHKRKPSTKENTLPKGRDKGGVKKQEIRFGENEQIRLTQEEYEKGKSDYPPGAWDECLQRVDDYIATNKKGSNYKNHNLVIRNWLKRDDIHPLKGNKNNHNSVIQQFKKKIKDLGITAHYEEDENSLFLKVEGRSWRLEKNNAIELNSAAIVSQLVGDVNV